MAQAHWQVSTFVAVGLAGYLALRKPHVAPTTDDASSAEARGEAAGTTRALTERGWTRGSAHALAPILAERIARLQRARSSGAQCKALEDLAATHAPEVAGVIVEATAAGRTDVRVCAIGALGRMGSDDAVSVLVALVADDESAVRGAAIAALATMQDENARAALLAIARSGEGPVRLEAALALGNVHCAAATPVLVAAMSTASESDLTQIASALGSSEDPEAYRPLLQLTRGLSAAVRVDAIAALGELGTREAVQSLGEMFAHARGSDGSVIAEALARAGTDDARRALMSAATGADREAATMALAALGDLEGTDVRDLMLENLGAPEQARSQAAYSYFTNHHDAAAEQALSEMMRTGSAEVATRALGVLSGANDDTARAALIEATHRGGEVGGNALSALARMPGGHDAARAAALETLRNNRGVATAQAVEVLAADPSREAFEALVHEARSGGVSQSTALDALASRGDAASARALMDIAQHGDVDGRSYAIHALGETRDPEARALLVQLAQGTTDRDGNAMRTAIAAGVPEAPALLATAIASADPDVRRNAMDAAYSNGLMLTPDQAERLARDPDQTSAMYGARFLAAVAPDRAREMALDDIRAAQPEQREAALRLAANLSDDVAGQIVTIAAHDTSDEVLGDAIEALQQRGGAEAPELIAQILARPGVSAAMRTRAASALAALGGTVADQNRAAIEAAMQQDADEPGIAEPEMNGG